MSFKMTASHAAFKDKNPKNHYYMDAYERAKAKVSGAFNVQSIKGDAIAYRPETYVSQPRLAANGREDVRVRFILAKPAKVLKARKAAIPKPVIKAALRGEAKLGAGVKGGEVRRFKTIEEANAFHAGA